jgi:hypothetical protein
MTLVWSATMTNSVRSRSAVALLQLLHEGLDARVDVGEDVVVGVLETAREGAGRLPRRVARVGDRVQGHPARTFEQDFRALIEERAVDHAEVILGVGAAPALAVPPGELGVSQRLVSLAPEERRKVLRRVAGGEAEIVGVVAASRRRATSCESLHRTS